MLQSVVNSSVVRPWLDLATDHIRIPQIVPRFSKAGLHVICSKYDRPLSRVIVTNLVLSSYNDPVNVMSPYWLNDSCNPFLGPKGTCSLGNAASYAINVTDATTVAAGIQFAQDKNIRLSIKNTGHDYLGRSSGKGSLALWTHNLKNISIINYTSPAYSGPAIRMGAGVQSFEMIAAAAEKSLRAVCGYCPTIGSAGGYSQNGGYGPLSASYGLAADNTLEFEVVTTDGRHLTASSSNNPDLYWALSGGGAGNYAVVLSQTVKAYADGPIGGAAFAFANTNSASF